MSRTALIILAVVGVLLGGLRAMTGSDLAQAVPDCPQHASVVLDPLRLEMSETDGAFLAHTSATFQLREVDPQWSTSQLEPSPSCVLYDGDRMFVDPQGQRTAQTWAWDPDEETLTLDFVGAPVAATALDENLLARSPEDSYLPIAAIAVLGVDPGELVLDLDPCRWMSETYSACTPDASGTIEIALPDEFVATHTPEFETSPTEVVSADGVTTYRWTFTGRAPHVAVRTAVGLGDTAPLLADATGGSLLFEHPTVWAYWIGAVRAASDLILLAAAALVLARLRKSPGRPTSTARSPYRILVGYLAVLAAAVLGFFEPLLDLLWAALAWAVVAAAWGRRHGAVPKRWVAAAVVAAIGMLLALASGDDILWMGETALVTTAAAALCVTAFIGGVLAIVARLDDATALLPSPAAVALDRRWRALPDLKRGIRLSAQGGFILGAGVLLGHVGVSLLYGEGLWDDSWSVAFQVVRDHVGWVSLAVVALLVAGFVAKELLTGDWARVPRKREVTAVALLLAAAAPPSAVVFATVELPLWLVTFGAALLVVRRREVEEPVTTLPVRRAALSEALAAQRSAAALASLDAEVSAGTGSTNALSLARAARSRARPSPTEAFLTLGSNNGWQRNALVASWCGAAIGLLPTTTFAWQAITNLPEQLESSATLSLVASILLQLLRWVGLAFVLGALYTVLPTSRGGSKALVLAGTWSAGALAAQLAATWLGASPSGLWLYISLQVLLFLVAVGVCLDLTAIWRAGGTWRRLGDLYGVHGMRHIVAYAGPLGLAVLGLANELRQGAGTDFAQQAVSAVTAVLGVPTP